MASQPPPGSRWTAPAGVIVGMIGLAITIFGALVAIGVWKGETDGKFAKADDHFATLDRRMDQAEQNDRTYNPIVSGMQVDLRYLADRARREDDARGRGRR